MEGFESHPATPEFFYLKHSFKSKKLPCKLPPAVFTPNTSLGRSSPLSIMKKDRTKEALSFFMAGTEGFEPPNAGTKTRCLTAWPRPNTKLYFTLKPRVRFVIFRGITILPTKQVCSAILATLHSLLLPKLRILSHRNFA
jgi:hypothetical protein